MAMEQLLELVRGGTDHAQADRLVVVDTPPALQALDFLDAPRRMLELLGSRAIKLLAPGANRSAKGHSRRSFSMVDLAARIVLGAFDRITGLHLLADVQGFVRNFDGMYNGFAERAAEVQALIREASSAIVLVTSAEQERVMQTREFAESLAALELKPAAIVVNRMMADLPDEAVIEAAELSPALVRKLKRNLADFAALKRRETIALDSLRSSLPADMPLLFAPDLGYEPRTLADIATIARGIHE
jgi:anion-transporting  ArsA/GET3 family ATPase